jgi:uncharacterized Ntn-hydrolase superfamily protein
MMLTISRAERGTFGAVIVAEAGERPNQTKTMNTNQFSLANRKQLAEVLGNQYDGPRRRAVQKFRLQREDLQKTLVKEYAEKRGVAKLVSLLEIAQQKCEDLRGDISKANFCVHSDGTIDVVSHSALDKIIDDRIEKEIGSADAIEARFDSAQIAMMTVASLEDADKLLKSVTTIQ